MANKVVKLTVFLMTPGTTVEAAIGDTATEWEKLKQRPGKGLPSCTAWVQRANAKPPKWHSWLDEGFELGPILNQNNSALLTVVVRDRLFVITFGYAWHKIDDSAIEQHFGLRVALSRAGPPISTLDSRSPGAISKQTRIHFSESQPLDRFGLEHGTDWVQAINAKVQLGDREDKRSSIVGTVRGSNSLQFSWQGDISSLQRCCDLLLNAFEDGRYRDHFPFIDSLREVDKGSPLAKTLDRELQRRLEHREPEMLGIASPTMPESNVVRFQFKLGRAGKPSRIYDDLSIENLFDFLDHCEVQKGRAPSHHDVSIAGLDSDDTPQTNAPKLFRYLISEQELNGATYVLSAGRWFEIKSDYLSVVQRAMDDIDDITDELCLPEWKQGTELDYNSTIARERGWLLLDQGLFDVGARQNRFECADIASPAGDFIHVKSMSSSKPISHLFAQGVVSAGALNGDQQNSDRFRELFRECFGVDPPRQKRVVYAMATYKKGPLKRSLFFFSKVNLMGQHKRLRELGWTCALCKIDRPLAHRPKARTAASQLKPPRSVKAPKKTA